MVLAAKAYNHNLDTSPEHYPNIVSTRPCAALWLSYSHVELGWQEAKSCNAIWGFFLGHIKHSPKITKNPQGNGDPEKKKKRFDPAVLGTYADRLETLANVREAGISVSGLDMFNLGSFEDIGRVIPIWDKLGTLKFTIGSYMGTGWYLW